MKKSGMTIFEVLLYIALLSVVMSSVLLLSIESTKAIARIREQGNKEKIRYFIQELVKYHADRSTNIEVVQNDSDQFIEFAEPIIIKIGSMSETEIKKVMIGDQKIRKLIMVLGTIENLEFVIDKVHRLILISYKLTASTCLQIKSKLDQNRICAEQITIDLI